MTGMVIPATIVGSILAQMGLSFFVVGWIVPAIMAGAQIVGTGISMYANRKNRTKNFENTDYGEYLQGISQRGVYSPKAKAGILGQVSRRAGNVASRQTAAARGQLASRGMENSIAGTRALSAPGSQMMNIMADKTSELETANEMSKVGAGRELAMGMNRSREMRRGENRQMYDILAGGVSDLGGSIASMAEDIGGDRAFAKVEPQYDEGLAKIKELVDAGDWEGVRAIVMQLSMLLGGS